VLPEKSQEAIDYHPGQAGGAVRGRTGRRAATPDGSEPDKEEEAAMIMFVLGFVVGLVVAWNFLPQPAWLKDMLAGLRKK